MIFILAVIFAWLNALRGAKVICDVLFSLGCGFSTAILFAVQNGNLHQATALFGVVFLGMWLWAAPGWGRYFTVIHGWKHVLLEREIAWIDYIADSITKNAYLNGFIGMSLRGFYAMPMFTALCWFNKFAPFIGLMMLLQGTIYFLAGRMNRIHAVRIAEVFTGGAMAALIYFSILVEL